MMTDHAYQEYEFASSSESHMHVHFMSHVFAFAGNFRTQTRVLDVGCGNGFLCGEFLKRGCKVVGIDLSRQGIQITRRSYPIGRFELLEANPDILERLGEEPFDLVVSTEVVEHLYAPREWTKACYAVLKRSGIFICTTPYHGYLKNLVLSLFGRWDAHANPLWDGGHIKLWSKRTLAGLLTEAGFENLQFQGAGRMPGFWMTMIVKAEKPQ